MQSPKLTDELIKFCCRNLVELDRLKDSDDWDVKRRADSRMGVFCNGMRSRLHDLGLSNPAGFSRFYRPPLDDIKEALRAMKALADDGSLDALKGLADLAMIAASCIRNIERMLYMRKHQSDLPWHQKPAEQYGAIHVRRIAEKIKDADVNKMLRRLDKKVASDNHAGQEQEDLNA